MGLGIDEAQMAAPLAVTSNDGADLLPDGSELPPAGRSEAPQHGSVHAAAHPPEAPRTSAGGGSADSASATAADSAVSTSARRTGTAALQASSDARDSKLVEASTAALGHRRATRSGLRGPRRARRSGRASATRRRGKRRGVAGGSRGERGGAGPRQGRRRNRRWSPWL
ncbi:uncharacterized protein LOC127781485 [Oryza glaberrima]|uniref:uncharacterized protein LOC127781485 n=1 Tax=Oryza glaberrima TaxID=4538 RepID=UPI00224C56D1|nr:uncharacterized protein LOC127781485 [Oryza glaberrima]